MTKNIFRPGLLCALALSAIAGPAAAQQIPAWCEASHAPSEKFTRPDLWPEMSLVGYDGELCPSGSLTFSANQGGVTILTSVEKPGDATCRVRSKLIVPAGFRFREPLFFAGVYANSDGEDPASQVSFNVSVKDANDKTIGHEDFSKPIVPVPVGSDANDETVFCDKVNVTMESCPDPTQPTVLYVDLDIVAKVQQKTQLRIWGLDQNFSESAQWTTCSGGF